MHPRRPDFCISAERGRRCSTGGKFLLRIEDTDKVRSTKPAIDAILDGMRWLELDWDGHEYYQSQFQARHAEVARELGCDWHTVNDAVIAYGAALRTIRD